MRVVENDTSRRRIRRAAMYGMAIGMVFGGRAGAITTVPLGAATGGVAVNYNTTGGEVPSNQAYVRAQFSVTNTNGAEFNFDATPLPGAGGASWYSIFQAVPNQFGVDLILEAPTSDNSNPTPPLIAYDNGNNTIAGRIPAGPVTWAISGYTGPSDGPANPADQIINSLFRGGTGAGDGISNLVISPVSQMGTVFTVTVSGELISDGLIHWYTVSTPDSPVGNFELTGKIFFNGTLSYDSSTDVNPIMDFYAGTVQLDAEVICAPRYVNIATGQDVFPGPAPNYCRNMGAPCKTIQRAVDIACPNDVVNVAAGTYPEQVTIGKALTIQGAGKTVTFIAPTSVTANTTSLSSAQPLRAIVLVHDAVDVTINDVKVDGGPAAFPGCGDGYVGIYYRNASGTIDASHVTNVFQPTTAGCQAVVAILAHSGASVCSLTVGNSMVDNYGKNGITCSLADMSCTITNNQVTGRGPVPLGDAAQNGIQFSGADGTIIGNTVKDNFYSPQTVCATGILVFGSNPGVLVSGNVLNGNLCDLYVDADTSTVQGNQIDPAGPFAVTLIGSGNTVSLNRVNGSTNAMSQAIYVDGVNNTFSCNRVSNNAGGGFFFDSTFTNAGAETAGTPNTLMNNSIEGNGVGVDGSALDPGDPDLTATSNWWGCAAGPGNPGCDTVTANVNAASPLAAPPPCVSCNSNADCSDGLACTGTETCNIMSHICSAGMPVICTGDQCNTSACVESSGTCVQTPKINGFACNDGNVCTTLDTCQAGLCVGSGGADSDGDGYCDQQEIAAGCNENDFREIPPQANVYSGGRGTTGGEVLLTYNAPAKRKITFGTDPSCGAAGSCSLVSHFCTSGAIGDPCSVNADCNHTSKCRIVINYAETADLALTQAQFKSKGQPKSDVSGLFSPVTPGCTRKVDITLAPGFRRALVRLKAIGTTNNRKRKDRDVVIYVE